MSQRPRVPKLDIPFTSDADIAAFVEQFEQCAWPYERWTHRAHLALGVFYSRALPPEDAVARIRSAIQRYNRLRGSEYGYHETITLLFMRLIRYRLRTHTGAAVELVNELVQMHDLRWLLRYYSETCLWSFEARMEWVEPDLAALDF